MRRIAALGLVMTVVASCGGSGGGATTSTVAQDGSALPATTATTTTLAPATSTTATTDALDLCEAAAVGFVSVVTAALEEAAVTDLSVVEATGHLPARWAELAEAMSEHLELIADEGCDPETFMDRYLEGLSGLEASGPFARAILAYDSTPEPWMADEAGVLVRPAELSSHISDVILRHMQPINVVVVSDCGENTPHQLALGMLLYLANWETTEVPGILVLVDASSGEAEVVAAAPLDDSPADWDSAVAAGSGALVGGDIDSAVAAIVDALDRTLEEAFRYDGEWIGTTSEDEDFSFVVERGAVTSLSYGYGGECAEFSPMSAKAFGAPLGWVRGDGVTASAMGVPPSELEGEFTSDTSADGTLALEFTGSCGDPRVVTWEGDLLGEDEVPPEQGDWWGAQPPVHVLPDVTIPSSQFDSAVGTSRFDENGAVFADNGIWYLVGSWMNVFIAVPAGWETVETGSETYLMFGESVAGDWPPIRVRLSSDGYDGDTRTSADVIAELEEALSTLDAAVLDFEIVDETRAWMLVSMVTDQELTRTMLMIFSKNPEEGWFHTFGAFAYEDVFPDYYPLLQAMVGSWYGLYDNALGVPLPESVP